MADEWINDSETITLFHFRNQEGQRRETVDPPLTRIQRQKVDRQSSE